ncbi:PEP-CTERM sorting domain-containing protein [Paludibaculum fermentans]|uniref:PEP-CTERM sorting domain-containing protein n=1 Tax=Paludibaculum fermentans TaxID=1473598 RepID=UPI003EC00CA2
MKRLISIGLLCVMWSFCAQGAVVKIWGDLYDLNTLNNFYSSIPGTTSTIASGTLDTVDLAGVKLLWAVQPADDYTPAELAKMASFLSSGGRIAFMGEHGQYMPDQNNRINAALTALGATIQINNTMIDTGFHDATVAGGQILANPLTAGVNLYNYACFATLLPTGTAQSLMLGTDLTNVMMAYQNVGPGSVFLITDQNVWDNVGLTASNDNHQMFENLLLGDTGAPVSGVPEPTTFALLGCGLVSLVVMARRRNS